MFQINILATKTSNFIPIYFFLIHLIDSVFEPAWTVIKCALTANWGQEKQDNRLK